MQSNFLKIILYIAVAFSSMAIACKKEKQPGVNSPAFKIRESERLTLPSEIELPTNLPNGNTRIATYYAEGVQKYVAQVKYGGSPVVYEWAFNGPQADLYDANNRKVGSHGFGPFWQVLQTDTIFAQASNPPAVAASPDNESITWLLLVPKAGRTATGIFANVSYIQRIATKGGKPPANPPTTANETADVPYTAIYRFTRKNP